MEACRERSKELYYTYTKLWSPMPSQADKKVIMLRDKTVVFLTCTGCDYGCMYKQPPVRALLENYPYLECLFVWYTGSPILCLHSYRLYGVYTVLYARQLPYIRSYCTLCTEITIHTVIQYFMHGSYHIYDHIRYISTALANPSYARCPCCTNMVWDL